MIVINKGNGGPWKKKKEENYQIREELKGAKKKKTTITKEY